MITIDDAHRVDTSLDVLEAAYRLSEASHGDWLHRIAEAARPQLDRGLGVATRLYRVTASGLEVGLTGNAGTDPELDRASRECMERAAAIHADVFRATRVCTESELVGEVGTALPLVEMILEPMRKLGIRDTLTVQICDPDGHGVFLAAPMEHQAVLSPAMRRRWQRIATHLLTASRLRRAIAAGNGEVALQISATGAVDGELADNEAVVGEAKDIVGVRRSVGRSAPDRVLDVWRGLVSGRWSIVDQTSNASDGRYVVLRRNPPTTPEPRAGAVKLSMRQSQVAAYLADGWANKEIGYALGISPSSVATLVERLKLKLGVTTRVELVLACSRLRS